METPHTSRGFVGSIIHALVARGMPESDVMAWLDRAQLEEQNRVKQEIPVGFSRNVSHNMLGLVQGIERRYVELLSQVDFDRRAAAHPEVVEQVVDEYLSGFATGIGKERGHRIAWTCPECDADLATINPHSLVCVSCKAELQPNSANNAFIYKR